MKHPVTLQNGHVIGHVEVNDQGLWVLSMEPDDELAKRQGVDLAAYTAGPFGTRCDAQREAVSVWERAIDMRWRPRKF